MLEIIGGGGFGAVGMGRETKPFESRRLGGNVEEEGQCWR